MSSDCVMPSSATAETARAISLDSGSLAIVVHFHQPTQLIGLSVGLRQNVEKLIKLVTVELGDHGSPRVLGQQTRGNSRHTASVVLTELAHCVEYGAMPVGNFPREVSPLGRVDRDRGCARGHTEDHFEEIRPVRRHLGSPPSARSPRRSPFPGKGAGALMSSPAARQGAVPALLSAGLVAILHRVTGRGITRSAWLKS